MSIYYCKLCSVLLLEHFGPVVQSVGDDLLKYNQRTLGSIRATVKLPLNKVNIIYLTVNQNITKIRNLLFILIPYCQQIKEAICVLIKYGFVDYNENEKFNEYTIFHDRIIMILRYPRYVKNKRLLTNFYPFPLTDLSDFLRYMYLVKSLHGDEAEMMLEELLRQGFETASKIIVKTFQKLQQLSGKLLSIISAK